MHYPHGNDIFEAFIADYAKALKRKGIDVAYLWVREQETSINHHYHLCLWLNGNEVQHHKNVLDLAERIWAYKVSMNPDVNNGLVHYCAIDNYGHFIDNGIMLVRNSQDEQKNFSRIIYSSSYLAKTFTKGAVMPGVRQFNHSRIYNRPFDQNIIPDNAYGQQSPI